MSDIAETEGDEKVKRFSGSVRLRRAIINGDRCLALELKGSESKEWGLSRYARIRNGKSGNPCVPYAIVEELMRCVDLGYKHVMCYHENEW